MKNCHESGPWRVKKGAVLGKSSTFFNFWDEGLSPLPLKHFMRPSYQVLGATPGMGDSFSTDFFGGKFPDLKMPVRNDATYADPRICIIKLGYLLVYAMYIMKLPFMPNIFC